MFNFRSARTVRNAEVSRQTGFGSEVAAVESLEDRRLMSLVPAGMVLMPSPYPAVPPSPAQVVSGVLRVRGTSGNDSIRITRDSFNAAVNVNGIVQSFSLGAFNRIDVSGLAGADRIDLRGMLSPATISGGTGNDTIFGSEAGDFIWGNDASATSLASPSTIGNDEIHGGAGDDTLVGDAGADWIYGDAGFDRLYGFGNNDVLTGGAADDFLDGGAGDDSLYGDLGNDQILGGDGDDLARGMDGNDSIWGGLGQDAIAGDNGDDSLWGEGGNDLLDGGDGADHLDGCDGDDVLCSVDFRNDSLFGGAGHDVAYCNRRSWGFIIGTYVTMGDTAAQAAYDAQPHDECTGIEEINS